MAVIPPPPSPFRDGDFTLTAAADLPLQHSWTTGALHVSFSAGPDSPVVVGHMGPAAPERPARVTQQLVELMVTGDGRARGTTRSTNTAAGSRLRYVSHETSRVGDEEVLRIVQRDPALGLVVTTTFAASTTVAAVRVTTGVENAGDTAVVVELLSSFAFGAFLGPGEDTRDLLVHSGTGEQLAENRWTTRPVWSQDVLADFNSVHHDQPGRGALEAVGTSTWSTARALPNGFVTNRETGRAFGWQIEHNGGWRWELDDVRTGEDSLGLVLMGPEDLDHHFSVELLPGQSFTSVPVSVATSHDGFDGVVAELHRHRRWLRRHQNADPLGVLVYNDFMNTLMGDPTTEKLLPLIEAAGSVGTEYFCIDAGWYDEAAGYWWPSVGEWRPSTTRFPDGGLPRVVAAIRAAGMKPGIWVEPEVIGVRSPVAQTLPDEAFLQRHGRRVVEQERYFLDLRHPEARRHLDDTFDLLVHELGFEFFKLDYNVTPGPGTDHAAFSAGSGLLEHNRAHLTWVEELRSRHPEVVFENCSSGAMRADFAMLERFDFQSTSDQMDFRLYPAIAAGAPVHLLPEQAGNWAYPQPGMDDEEIAFNLVTGLSGRLYLSGFLDGMDEHQRGLVAAGTALYKEIRAEVAASVPSWPLGLPDWYADTIALVLHGPNRSFLHVWRRTADQNPFTLDLGVPADRLEELYPVRLDPWKVGDSGDGRVTFHPVAHPTTARVYEIHRS